MLSNYQERLAAQDTYGLLVVLQALDAGGKDSTIRHVMSGVNPQGVVVQAFKAPSEEELDHDYLWRHTQKLPQRGQIGIFNRSHTRRCSSCGSIPSSSSVKSSRRARRS
jgi:polyphosphate kinase 2 (PPK2 family)